MRSDRRLRSRGNLFNLLNEVWMERAPYSDRYHLFRLVAHLAKYWTAEFAVDTAKWAMEVHGGLGVLAEYGAERWLREAMILAIWEGTSHRQILDGLEVMERKQAHQLLFRRLAEIASSKELQDLESEVEQHLKLPAEKKKRSPNRSSESLQFSRPKRSLANRNKISRGWREAELL